MRWRIFLCLGRCCQCTSAGITQQQCPGGSSLCWWPGLDTNWKQVIPGDQLCQCYDNPNSSGAGPGGRWNQSCAERIRRRPIEGAKYIGKIKFPKGRKDIVINYKTTGGVGAQPKSWCHQKLYCGQIERNEGPSSILFVLLVFVYNYLYFPEDWKSMIEVAEQIREWNM